MAPAWGLPPGPEAMVRVLRAAEATRHQNKVVLRNASDWRKLLELAEDLGDDAHVLNICTIFHRVARSVVRGGPRSFSDRARTLRETAGWTRLLELVASCVPDCNNMEITNCLWALATLEARGEAEEALAIQLCEAARTYIDSFEPRNLALSAWALAKLGYRNLEWCRCWAVEVERHMQRFEVRDMTNIIWAFATLHWRDEGFLAQFCKSAELKWEQYLPQDLGNTLWALATLGFRHEPALAALSKRVFDIADTFDQQNLSISLWSYATLGYKNMNLFHYMTQLITDRINTFASQGIANVVWALAKFQFQQKCLLMTIAEIAPPQLDEYDPQHLSIVAWAYATLEFPNRPLLSALCQAATRRMHIFSAQHMANMTWAMATLAHKDERYLQALAIRALEQVESFNPQECSNLAWAFALLTFKHDGLLAALSIRSQEIVSDFIPQNLGNTAWAYNRLGFRDEALMQCLVHEAATRLHECAGQEVLDVIESVTTGGYEEVLQGPAWSTLLEWSNRKYSSAKEFLDQNGGMPLELRKLSDFDRALSVQDYKDHLASFDLVGLGYTYTAQLLEHLGVRLPEGSELDAWQQQAQMAAQRIEGTGNESDVSKNAEAQEGLKVCRTVCVYRFNLFVPATGSKASAGPIAVTSGSIKDAHELGLFAATLRHPRGGDGEFQALQACARACLSELGCDPLGPPPLDGAAVRGELWLHVSEVPCLSCCGAFAQFRKLFPDVRIVVSFTLGRQPAASSSAAAAALLSTSSAVTSTMRHEESLGSGSMSGGAPRNRVLGASADRNNLASQSPGACTSNGFQCRRSADPPVNNGFGSGQLAYMQTRNEFGGSQNQPAMLGGCGGCGACSSPKTALLAHLGSADEEEIPCCWPPPARDNPAQAVSMSSRQSFY
eukprot:TRINITY_DN27202_c0_g1_i1.p1 TRINITY_DN27202_c0_g1~~TRINITY_DN27202_c0_g1_i1.p1  ORF type:complete len:907 (+),score=130.62 TRINITY_DN27202_c0_g1_i1:32-2722(+)